MATPLRALIAAIPHVGASIEGVFAGPASKTVEPRLQFMFVELHREMRVLDESRIRKRCSRDGRLVRHRQACRRPRSDDQ